MKYKIITYGCQMNEHDSERIAGILEKMGYSPTDENEEADFLLYNTCLVRENAELKVYGQLGSLKNLKKRKPEMILAVSGCMMQTGSAIEVIKDKYSHVDIIFGTRNIDMLPELISLHKQKDEMVVDISTYRDPENINYAYENTYSAYVNIMQGCNNFCSYCIVPYARGREESRPVGELIEEIERLARRGYKEIELLGQNVNSYKGDNGENFPYLLKEVCKVDGIEWVRFMTSNPKDLSDELIEVMASEEKVCKHLHLPLQSGSTRILKKMNRKYTKESYLELVDKLRDRIPDIALTTDIIVGFPGETEEDHQETIDVCKRVGYDQAYTFIYSIREGTPAAKMEQVDEEIKHERFNRLLDEIYPGFYEINSTYLGMTEKVLVHSISKNDDEVVSGRTSTNKLVHFKGNESMIGNFYNVKITDHTSFTLEGELVD